MVVHNKIVEIMNDSLEGQSVKLSPPKIFCKAKDTVF